MSLEFQISQNPFRSGLAEGVEPHQVTPGTLLTAENVVWKKSGKIEKRFGVSAITTSLIGGGNLTAGARLFTRGSELCLVDGTSLYAYSPTSSAWRLGGAVPPAQLTWSTGLDAITGVMASCNAVSSTGIQIVAWIVGEPTAAYGTTGAARFFVRGPLGESLIAPTEASAVSNHLIRTIIIGTTAYLFTQNGSNLVAITVNLTTLAVTVFGTIISNVKVQGWDACVIGSNIVFAYEDTGGGLKLKSVDSSLAGVATGSISGEASSNFNCISIDGASGGTLYVGYYADISGLVRAACADPSTLVQTVAPVTLENISAGPARVCKKVGVVQYGSTSCIVAWSPQDASTTGPIRTSAVRFTNAGAIDTSVGGKTYGLTLLTKPFALAGKFYAMCVDRPSQGTPQGAGSHTVVMRMDGAGVLFPYVAKLDLLIGGLAIAGALAAVSTLGTTAYFPVPFVAASSPVMGPFKQGLRLARFATPSGDVWRTVTYGGEAYSAGALLAVWDGALVFDYGFEREPTYVSQTNATAGLLAAGSYIYTGVREFRSAAGVLHRSSAGIQFTGTSSGLKQIVITVVTGGVSNKQNASTSFGSGSRSPVEVVTYRSTVGGSVPQRLTLDPSFTVTLTDSTVAVETVTDNHADADIGNAIALATRPAVYTTGGILDDYQPPSNVTGCYHADRLWVLAGDGMTWWYSKAFQDDLGTAPGFNPQLRISFADPQTAMASMDDKAIFFSATGVKYMLGTGPAPNGLNSDFQTPTTIQSDVGCTNARSVVATPDGVMFLSDRGIHLLDRGLTLSWIGRPVKDTLAAFPAITSAVLVPKQNQVRFTCNAADGSAGATIVYDYVEKQWSTFRHWAAGNYGTAYADACLYNGQWAFVTANGVVSIESTSSYLDSGNYVPMTLETAWMNAAGPLAFQSVRNLQLHGTSYTDHDLTISIGFDSDPSYPQSVTYLATSPVTAVGSEEPQVTIGPRRKCNSIRFKIVDASPAAGSVGIGRGPSWDMMGLEVGIKRGFGNTPATKKG